MVLISSGESLCIREATSSEVLNECCGVEVAAASKLIIVVLPGALRPLGLPWLDSLVCDSHLCLLYFNARAKGARRRAEALSAVNERLTGVDEVEDGRLRTRENGYGVSKKPELSFLEIVLYSRRALRVGTQVSSCVSSKQGFKVF